MLFKYNFIISIHSLNFLKNTLPLAFINYGISFVQFSDIIIVLFFSSFKIDLQNEILFFKSFNLDFK